MRDRICRWTHRLGIRRHFCRSTLACAALTPRQWYYRAGFLDGMAAERGKWLERHAHEWALTTTGSSEQCWCGARRFMRISGE